jgi:hypothetical protein
VATLLSQRGWTRECEALLEERLEGRKDDPLLTAWLYFFYRAHGKPDAARELKEARLPGLDGEARMQLERMLKGIDNHFAGQAREKNADGAEGEQQAPASSRRREQDD